jgi:4-diphosphocytidyl-2-C-methyl-D-erythritol kinase
VTRIVADAPAKINLTLRVLNKRSDGFHELDTIYQVIDLWDTLEFEAADEISMTTDHPALACDDSNLVLRAARLLVQSSGTSHGATIRLRKRIPLQGGLGGGSSDAAAALLGCDRLWGLESDPALLDGLARQLGADVPFFLHGGTARGTQRGDCIAGLQAFGERALLLGLPPFGSSTAEVFKRASEWLTLPSNSVNFSALFGHKWRQPNDLGFLGNDLQNGVFEDRPELKQFREGLLEAGASTALMSGSGSTVFGIFEAAAARDAALNSLGDDFDTWTLVPSRTLDEGIRIRVG